MILQRKLKDACEVNMKVTSDGSMLVDVLNGENVNIDEVWRVDATAGRNVAQIFDSHRELSNGKSTQFTQLSTKFIIDRLE